MNQLNPVYPEERVSDRIYRISRILSLTDPPAAPEAQLMAGRVH
jgi:hypothetical protein